MYEYYALTLPKTLPSSACTFPGTLSPLCPLHLHTVIASIVLFIIVTGHTRMTKQTRLTTNLRGLGDGRLLPVRFPDPFRPDHRGTWHRTIDQLVAMTDVFGLESGEKGSPQSLPPSTRTVRSTPPPAPAPSITLCGSRWRSCKSAIGYRQKRSILVGIGDTLPWFPVRFRF